MSHHDDDVVTNLSPNPTFESVLARRISRRDVMRGGVSMAAASMFGSLALVGCGNDPVTAPPPGPMPLTLGFDPVAKSLEDRITVPAGYNARVLYAKGDPIAAGVAAYLNDGTQGDFDRRAGDQHDGMHYFGLSDGGTPDPMRSDRGLLCMNHEQLLDAYLHANGPTEDGNGNRPQAEVVKEMNAHGVSVVEVRNNAGTWEYVQGSSYNRRITAFTPMSISGTARGSALLGTPYSPGGVAARGTLNNCANGYTPWGTYLTCEENWFSYFRRGDDAAQRSAAENTLFARYGIGPNTSGFSYRKWDTVAGGVYERFDVSADGASASVDWRNEPNQFGYIVEIDPFDADSTPVKRTTLGRFGHEGCWIGPVVAGQPLVFYMGDDSRFEYIYKFVSEAVWDPADANGGLAVGAKYLDRGNLYVARFNADGSGDWLELAYGVNGLDENNAIYPFVNDAAVIVASRLAADSVGATKMDRPEWGAVNLTNGEVYMTLTNNTRRTAMGSTDAANPRNYDAVVDNNPDLDGNSNGHIIRWRESDGNASTAFTWDIYLFGATATADADTVNVSGLTAENDFSSPDGLWFDRRGLLWIQTDDGFFPGNDLSNNQMLVAIPGSVGDGGAKMIGSQGTFVGKSASTSNLRRFLVGPKGCEITGIDMTPDYKTLFVNIQHPGEDGDLTTLQSNWPNSSRDATVTGNTGSRPRSATIVITRSDGGELGV